MVVVDGVQALVAGSLSVTAVTARTSKTAFALQAHGLELLAGRPPRTFTVTVTQATVTVQHLGWTAGTDVFVVDGVQAMVAGSLSVTAVTARTSKTAFALQAPWSGTPSRTTSVHSMAESFRQHLKTWLFSSY